MILLQKWTGRRTSVLVLWVACVTACGHEAAPQPPARPRLVPALTRPAEIAASNDEAPPEEFAGETVAEWAARLEGYPFLRCRGRVRWIDERALEASRCAELEDAGPEVLPLLRELLVFEGRPGPAGAARDALLAQAKLRPEPVIDLLEPVLRDRRKSAATRACAVLVGIGGPRVVRILAELIEDWNRPGLARSAAIGLRSCGPAARGAVPQLLSAMQSENEEQRRYAGMALEEIGGEEVAQGLLRTLRHPNVVVRLRAAELLGHPNIRGEGASAALVDALGDTDPAVCLEAAESLHELEEPAVTVLPTLRNLLRHTDAEIRGAAAYRIRCLGTEGQSAVPDLIAALSDFEPRVRGEVAEALGSVGGKTPGVAAALLDALDRERGDARCSLLWALGDHELMLPRGIPVVAAALTDEDADVRSAAARVLGSLGEAGRPAVPVLVRALYVDLNDDGEAVGDLIEALGAIGGDEAMWALVEVLDDLEGIHADDAAEALGAMGRSARAAVPHIEAALRRDEQDENGCPEEAAKALGRIGGDRSILALRRGLEEGDWGLRDACETALEKLMSK